MSKLDSGLGAMLLMITGYHGLDKLLRETRLVAIVIGILKTDKHRTTEAFLHLIELVVRSTSPLFVIFVLIFRIRSSLWWQRVGNLLELLEITLETSRRDS